MNSNNYETIIKVLADRVEILEYQLNQSREENLKLTERLASVQTRKDSINV